MARFGSVSELAAAVAHEINQPPMAAGTYIRLVADTISSGNIDTGEVAETAKKAAAQVDRAAQVIRRLRALLAHPSASSVSSRKSSNVPAGP